MEAFVTLVATDAYAAGALVLAHRLRDLDSKKPIVCMVTPSISSEVREALSKVCTLFPVDTLRSEEDENLKLLGRPELDITYTKLHLWRLTEYTKVVFLDADTLPLKNIDNLFERPSFSAAPDAGWPDCFNSGVFVAEPADSIFADLMKLASEKGSFDGGDQGLLNTYFSEWPASPQHRLPFTFNTTPTAQYGYAPAHNQFNQNISILHFIGENKPWKYQRFSDGKVLPLGNAWEGLKEQVQLWWDTWDKHYGRTIPHHLLSGMYGEFDSSFMTVPITPFERSVKNAWKDQSINLDDERRQVRPMPPITSITISQPKWMEIKQENNVQEKSQPVSPLPSKHQTRHHEQGRDNNKYSMIEWNPAFEEPPNTGSLGADIPDLSRFKNVWDQPLREQQHIWVAPVHHPEPEIMTKPEYSHYNTEDYVADTSSNNDQEVGTQDSHQEGFEHTNSFPWDSNPHHFPTPTRIWQDEAHNEHLNDHSEQHDSPWIQEHHHHHDDQGHHHQEHHHGEYHQEHQGGHHNHEHHHHEHHHQENHHHEHHHHEHHHQEHHHQEYHHHEHHQPEHHHQEYHHHEHHQPEHHHHEHHYHGQDHHHYVQPEYHQPEHHQYQEHHQPEHHHSDDRAKNAPQAYEHEHQQELLLPEHLAETETAKSIQEHYIEEKETEVVISQQDETQDSSQQNASQLPLFAMDEQMHYSAQTKMDEFIASLVEHEDNDISDRDLIPIRFKTSSRLQQDIYSPIDSRPNSKPVSRSGSRSTSRRASVSKSRRDSVASQTSVRNISPPIVDKVIVETDKAITYTVPEDIEQSHKLFAAGMSAKYSTGKTPYTSAAVTPAVSLTPDEFQGYEYFDQDEEDGDFGDMDTLDYFPTNQYSLSQSLLKEVETSKDWDPLDALSRLKVHSDNMVLRQSLHEALVKTAKEQEKQQEEHTSIETRLASKRYGFKSSWDGEEYELPSALASGQSSPRTPIFRNIATTDLSREIELEKERYKQQRASLMLAKPQTAIASTLEAELDLSQGTIFKKRYLGQHFEVIKSEETPFNVSSPTLPIQQDNDEKDVLDKPLESYYNDHIVQESKRRLAMLLEGRETEPSTPENSLFLPDMLRIAEEQAPVQFDLYELNKLQKPFVLDTKSYRSNFGFDKYNKVKIYQTSLFDDDEDLDSCIPKSNDFIVQKSPLDKSDSNKRDDAEKTKESKSTRGFSGDILKLKAGLSEEELPYKQPIKGFEVDVISVESETEEEEELPVQTVGHHGIEFLTVEVSDEEVETITIEVSDDDLEIVIIETPNGTTTNESSVQSTSNNEADVYVVQTVRDNETEACSTVDMSDAIAVEVSAASELDTVCIEIDTEEQAFSSNEIDVDIVDITKWKEVSGIEPEKSTRIDYIDVKTMSAPSLETTGSTESLIVCSQSENEHFESNPVSVMRGNVQKRSSSYTTTTSTSSSTTFTTTTTTTTKSTNIVSQEIPSSETSAVSIDKIPSSLSTNPSSN